MDQKVRLYHDQSFEGVNMTRTSLELVLHTIFALAILGAYVYTDAPELLALLAGQAIGGGISAGIRPSA